MEYIKSFVEIQRDDLPKVGGKGLNLGFMTAAGFPVPEGFCITTAAYRDFVAENRIGPEIAEIRGRCDSSNPAQLEKASESIRGLFDSGRMPDGIREAVIAAYDELHRRTGGPFVAVRSSATAEDLPDLSFAGQQDTYLNVKGEAAVIDAVQTCWSSLWTARAIGYRFRNRIAEEALALSVVIQSMVASDSSGVMFTANPLSGRRTEVVIDATLGLGEALVSGQVEPDHYVVDAVERTMLRKEIGSKKFSIRGAENGGTEASDSESRGQSALSDREILELADMGLKVEAYYGKPQDIEWAYHGGKLYLLQSRAVTSLYPLPDGSAKTASQLKNDLKIYLSFASLQVMMDPMTPMGREVFCTMAEAFGGKLGFKVDSESQKAFLSAGGRLYINITPLIRNPLGRKAAIGLIESHEPSVVDTIRELMDDSRFGVIKKGMRLRTFFVLVGIFTTIVFDMFRIILRPKAGRERIHRKARKFLSFIILKMSDIKSPSDLAYNFKKMIKKSQSKIIPFMISAGCSGLVPVQILSRLVSDITESGRLVMDLSRGQSHNVTTEMDFTLWDASVAIRESAHAREFFLARDVDELMRLYFARRLPDTSQRAIDGFIDRYGMRGPGEIDMGRPRWRDNPASVLQALKSYLLIDESQSPRKFFSDGAIKSRETADWLVASLRKSKGGFVKARLAKFMYKRIVELGGLRELPKYYVVQISDSYRRAFLECGGKMSASGLLKNASDIFFLKVSEMKEIVESRKEEFQKRILERKLEYEKEMSRKRIPRLMLSDGTVFYEGMKKPASGAADVLAGTPVSAGSVVGIVRVIIDPSKEHLLPGEILVCPATDPAWTPLFLSACGLVMEVGGMMTHGSLVAREYGIPAVVGVDRATEILKTGDRVSVDGSSGTVTLLSALGGARLSNPEMSDIDAAPPFNDVITRYAMANQCGKDS